MATDPFEEADRAYREATHPPMPTAAAHLAMCADFTLVERVRRDLKVIYRCADCDFRFDEDHPDIEALTYDAFRYTVPLVHPSKYRPKGTV